MARQDRDSQGFSRREQQIMDALFELGRACVADIQARLPKAPSDTAVRTLLGILVDKGHVRRHRDGRRNLYEAVASREGAGRSALRRVLDVFFQGSLEDALAAHLNDSKATLEDDELKRLTRLIREARRRSS